MSKRRNHDVVFKARIAQQWKKPLLECAAGMFKRGGKVAATAKIGDLAVANDVLAKQIKPRTGK